MKKYLTILIFIGVLGSSEAQWMKVEDVSSSSSIPSIWVEKNNIYAGADSLIYISSDYGKTWSSSSIITRNVDFVSAIIAHQNKIFVGTYNYGVYLSTDNGASWNSLNTGLVGAGAKSISDFVIRDGILYAGTYGSGVFEINLSTLNHWAQFSNGLSSGYSYSINSLKLIDDVLYAGAGVNGYYYKNDHNSNFWQEIKFGDFYGEPLAMLDIIKYNSEYFISASYGLYKSKDGINWNYYNPGVGGIYISNFAVHDEKIFVHLSNGVGRTFWFNSADGGNSWNYLEEQRGVDVMDIAVIENKIFTGRLYGMYYLPLNTTELEEEIIPVDFSLAQNYPNPFNPITTIKYSIPTGVETSYMTSLRIFDILGSEVATLVNEKQSAGNYEVKFDGSHLVSGVYFYKLEIGSFSTVKKMLLMK
ncbi:MAG: T9SS type A sorting domain-containing protein [Melioribacteraceae bacterium]|nr:T9SS type A sorting domain-containing protein [Melioribacteraceae bacterium]